MTGLVSHKIYNADETRSKFRVVYDLDPRVIRMFLAGMHTCSPMRAAL